MHTWPLKGKGASIPTMVKIRHNQTVSFHLCKETSEMRRAAMVFLQRKRMIVVLLLVKLGNQPLLLLSFPNLLPFRYRIKVNTFWTLWQLWVAVHSFNTFNHQIRVSVAELPREWPLKTPACSEFCLCDLGRAVLPFKVVFTASSFVKSGKW